MPIDRVDVVRRIYRALAGGGADVFDLLDPAIVWITPPPLPWTVSGSGGRYGGHDELRGYFASFLEQVETFEIAVSDLLPTANGVLMLGHERGTSRATGKRFDARCAHLWTLQDGTASRLDGHIDTLTVARAFALEP